MPTTKQRAKNWRTMLVHYPKADPRLIATAVLDPVTDERGGVRFDRVISRHELKMNRHQKALIKSMQAAALEACMDWCADHGIDFDRTEAEKVIGEEPQILEAASDPRPTDWT